MKHYFTKTNVDFTQSGAISLHEMTQNYIGTYIIVEVVSKNSASGVCMFSVGTNSPDYDNLTTPSTLFAWDLNEGETAMFNSGSVKRKLLNTEELFLNVMSPFSGTYTVNVYGIGFDPNGTPEY